MIKHHRPLVIQAPMPIEEPPLPHDVPRIQVDLVHTTRTEVTHVHRPSRPFASLFVQFVTAFWLVPVVLIAIRVLSLVAGGEPLLATMLVGAFLMAFCSACWIVSLAGVWLYKKTTE